MDKLDRKKRKVAFLILAGAVFLIYWLGYLRVLVLGAAAMVGALAALSLLADIPRVRPSIRGFFAWIERKVVGT